MEKPTGIKVVAIVALILTGMAILSALTTFVSGMPLSTSDSIMIVTSFFLSVILSAGSIGLLLFKKWARQLFFYTAVVIVVKNLGQMIYLVSSGSFNLILIISSLIAAGLYGYFAFYVNKKNVKTAFS